MKNISYVISGVLAVAIIVLFILFFTSKGSGAGNQDSSLVFAKGDSVALLPVAFVNIDSLLMNYDYFKDMNDQLMKKSTNSNQTLNNRQRQLEAEYADFKKKIDNNVFLSNERAQQEAARIQKLEADLQSLGQRYQNEFMAEQAKLNSQIADSVRLGLEIYNKTANYQIIFSNSGLDNILFARDAYDITGDIIKLLNNRYKPEAAK